MPRPTSRNASAVPCRVQHMPKQLGMRSRRRRRGRSRGCAGGIRRRVRRVLRKFLRYRPRLLHTDPDVLLLSKFLTETEADRLAELGAPTLRASKVASDVNKASYVDEDQRTSKVTWCNEHYTPGCASDPVVRRVEARASEVVDIPIGHTVPMQLLSYEPGQKYARHHDQDQNPDDARVTQGARVFTLLLYLAAPEAQ